MSRAGPGQSQELHLDLPCACQGAQIFGTGSWIGSGTVRIRTCTHLETAVTGSGFHQLMLQHQPHHYFIISVVFPFLISSVQVSSMNFHVLIAALQQKDSIFFKKVIVCSFCPQKYYLPYAFADALPGLFPVGRLFHAVLAGKCFLCHRCGCHRFGPMFN